MRGGRRLEGTITEQKVRNDLKSSGLTVKQVLELLEKCKSDILREMPISESLKSKLTW